ncbi:MAG: tetratricopeptide repeat protein [candidate division Zixibacteria bacterium]|nr:tetratricopeptide repeat protein [candidate division Zixibacteria bacterium]
METKKTKNLGIAAEKNLVWLGRIMVFLCGAVLLLRLVSSNFPKQRLWGINHLAYFSPYFAVAITILGLLVLVPKINHWLQNSLKKVLSVIYEFTVKRHKYLYFIVFSFLSIVVFWLLKVKIPLLGDGYYLITLLSTAKVIPTGAPLEIAVHLYLYKFLGQFIAVDAMTIYALVSYLAGAIFIFFAILTADLLGKNKFEKVFVFSILVSMGSILLFFGYAEHYSLTYASILAYLYFSLRYLKKESNILPATLTFIISCSLHLQTFYLFPSLVFLYLLKSDVGTGELHVSKKRIFLLSLLCIPIIIGMGVYMMEYIKHSSLGAITVPFTITLPQPPLGMAYHYTLFSSAHLLDMLNEHLLVSPVGSILLLTVVATFGLKNIVLRDRIFQFLVLVLLFQLAFHFFIYPDLGSVRDWDLFCFTALGYSLLGIYLFLKLVQDQQRMRYIGTVLVFTSVLSTLPWVMLNASIKKSLERIVDALELHKGNLSFYIYVEDYLKKMGSSGAQENKRMDKLFREHYLLTWLHRRAREQVEAGDLDSAEAIYEEAVRIAPWRISTHFDLGAFHLGRGRLDQAISEFEKAIQADPEDTRAFKSYVELGYIYFRKRELEKAIEMYKTAVQGEIENKDIVYQNLGHCYLLKNEPNQAILAYQEALRSNPNFIEPHLYLGHAYYKKGIKDKALQQYRIYLEYATDEEEVEKIKALILELNQE